MNTSEHPRTPVLTSVLLTRRQVASLLGVSYSTVCRLAWDGKLEEIRLRDGGQPKYRRADVLALTQTKAQSP
jgi:excisionase family DNA binding protein